MLQANEHLALQSGSERRTPLRRGTGRHQNNVSSLLPSLGTTAELKSMVIEVTITTTPACSQSYDAIQELNAGLSNPEKCMRKNKL